MDDSTPSPIDDIRIRCSQPLLAPGTIIEEYPATPVLVGTVSAGRRAVIDSLFGTGRRLLVVVGPCSIHHVGAGLAYAERLAPLARELSGDLAIVMRVYFEKPRTRLGWKGLINDPFLDGSFAINTGLRWARELLAGVNDLGLPAATEFLDTVFGQYFADLVSWGAIGARTVESQVHRELASGLSMPVGFKNRTDGAVQPALDAIRASAHPHWFPSLTKDGRPAILGTAGNCHGHLVLRGGKESGPNYHSSAIEEATMLLQAQGLPEAIVVDCSHDNSGKDPFRQPVVAEEIARMISSGHRSIRGVMLESHLLGGHQVLQKGVVPEPGLSITDPCLGFDETESVLRTLAKASRRRSSLVKETAG